MLFLNPWLLGGLAAVLIPVIIHLVRRQAAKPLDWGAMRFLMDTLASRRRKMEWEDLLLMAARCLLVALVALAIARPFLPPDSAVPWWFVLPAALAGVAALAGSFVLSGKWRWIPRMAGLLLLLAAAALVIFERELNLKRFEATGRRDVALVIDASSSMDLRGADGRTAFVRAVEEAKQLVKEAPRGTAFLVVLGGPAPEMMTASPLTHRADVLGVLDTLRPVGGTFRAHEALGMATLGLAEGGNDTKEIVVFTDVQRAGWRFDQPAAWDPLGAAWKSLPARPRLVLRDLGLPATLRNVALSGLTLSRAVVGTDREVTLRVTVDNTGTAPLTPGPVTLESPAGVLGTKPVGLLLPGQSETLEFRHRFTSPGPQAVTARIDARDDLASDDRAERVVSVRRELPVLLVEGNPSASFFDRAAGYLALALAPGRQGDGEFLMQPAVVAAPDLAEGDIANASVIVLADVPRLPENLASRLSAKVAEGAGLIILAGPRVEPAFYNGWRGIDGPVLPSPLGGMEVAADGVAPAESTFGHESVALFRDGKNSDLAAARVKQWRAMEATPATAASFANGSPFLAARSYGSGRTLTVSCAFDARAGNLPALRGFVPLVHELVTWAAGGGVDLNVAAGWSPSIALPGPAGGLTADYWANPDWRAAPRFTRHDPAIDFRWGNGQPDRNLPADRFSIEWRGELVPPVSGEYEIFAKVDDTLQLKIGDRPTLETGWGRREMGKVTLEAGRAESFVARYREEGGDAYARLMWTPPGGVRQIIPAHAFRPAKAPEAGAPLRATDPAGMPRQAVLRPAGRGRELAISGAAVPGIYQVAADEELRRHLDLPAELSTVPVSVARDAGESRFDPRTEDDLALVRRHADLVLTGSVADILAVLQGKGFGREIWRLLAAAAVVFFLLESLLARWVSRNRRVGEEVRVDFGADSSAWAERQRSFSGR